MQLRVLQLRKPGAFGFLLCCANLLFIADDVIAINRRALKSCATAYSTPAAVGVEGRARETAHAEYPAVAAENRSIMGLHY